jgi:calcineurin-like phosphoesterase family protein
LGPPQRAIRVCAWVSLAAAIVAGAVALAGCGGSGPTTTATPGVLRLTTVEDAYVNADRPDQNYGAADVLRVDGSPAARAYLRFDLRSVQGAPTTARLRILATSDSDQGFVVSRAGEGWTEAALTFADAPAASDALTIPSGPVSAGARTDVDVTRLVSGDGPLSLVLTAPGPTNVALASREAGAPAELVLDFRTSPPPPPPRGGEASLVAVGDIADCRSTADEATARLVARSPGTLATLGDTVYESGSPQQFADCYAPAWGRFRNRTRPTIGNHEYLTRDAAGYFDYFGAASGAADRGYYSYDLGAWHVVVLNSNCARVGGCQHGSPQERWLAADLAAHPAMCTLAYWHHPRFSSGVHGDFEQMQDVWQTLEDAGADLVLTGHDHDYERFAPQTATGAADPARGIVEFVVGTGGKNLRPIRDVRPNSVIRNDQTYGVLRLRLRPSGYDWRFAPVPGSSFSDSGSAACH